MMLNSFALDVLPEQGYMERQKGSKVMLLTVDKPMMDIGTIVPITVGHKYIISEAKVVKSDIFTSQLKIILVDDNSLVPNFECYDPMSLITVEKPKGRMSIGKSEQLLTDICKVVKVHGGLEDLRPVAGYDVLFERLPNLLDYNGLKNLQMNVRFNK